MCILDELGTRKAQRSAIYQVKASQRYNILHILQGNQLSLSHYLLFKSEHFDPQQTAHQQQ